MDKKIIAIIVLMLIAVISILSIDVNGDPTGASLTWVNTSIKTASSPDSRTDSKGTINTVLLTAEQQDLKWKAYVGNISSNFVLDDQDDYSIYQWTVTDFTGQVYITRDGSVTWSTITNATTANKNTEDSNIGHTSSAADSVTSTFSNKAHKAFTVAGQTIPANSAYSIATWINDTAQTPSSTQPFVEVLLWDTTGGDMIYTTFVESDDVGYRNQTTFDFQAIVPEDGQSADPDLTYYFYLELATS